MLRYAVALSKTAARLHENTARQKVWRTSAFKELLRAKDPLGVQVFPCSTSCRRKANSLCIILLQGRMGKTTKGGKFMNPVSIVIPVMVLDSSLGHYLLVCHPNQ